MPRVKVLIGKYKGKILDTIEIFWTDNTVTCRLEDGDYCEFGFEEVELLEE